VADVSVPLAHERIEPVEAHAVTRERFLTWPRAAGVTVFVLFALTFNDARVHDDGGIYFEFLRRTFGVKSDGVAYQFGSAVWNVPFWLASQLVAVRGGFDHFHSGEVAINVASTAAIIVTLYLGWCILRELELPRGPAVLLLTLFGTPLYFYGALGASYKHAADALYATALFWFVFRSIRPGARRLHFVAAGACLALLLATRYANVALCLGVIGGLAVLGLRRAAAWTLATLVVVGGVLFAIPVIRHIPYTAPPNITYGMGGSPDAPSVLSSQSERFAAGAGVSLDPVLRQTGFSITAPLKMLFTLHRGLFLYTPLTAFATLGFVLLLRRDRRNRPFLVVLGVSAFALWAIHSFWGRGWDGGGSFSQRFLTALFPFFLVGTAELVRRWRRPAIAVLTLCAAWSLWVGLVVFNGYYGSNARDGLPQIVSAFHGVTGPRVSRFHPPPPNNSLENFGRQIGDRITGRWRFYWRLVT
jgi:hypothetical protein